MDDAGRLRGLHAARIGPGPGLVGSGGEERFEIEQFVGRFDEPRHARLPEAHVFEEHLPLLVALQFGDVGLGRRRYDQQFGLFVGDGGAHGLCVGVARHGALLVHVADVEHRFVGQQVQVGHQAAVLPVQFDRAGAPALFEGGLVLQEQLHGPLGLLVAARRGGLLRLGESVLDGLEVLELQLGVDDPLVAHGVDRPVHVGDVAVVEAAQDVDDGVRVPDVAEEFVAQSLALRGALDQSGDVHDFDGRGYYAFGVVDFGQPDQPFVGDGDYPHVGFYRAEGKVRRLRLRVRQAVEKGRFSDVRKTHDAAL